jgi:hypothetical protein
MWKGTAAILNNRAIKIKRIDILTPLLPANKSVEIESTDNME